MRGKNHIKNQSNTHTHIDFGKRQMPLIFHWHFEYNFNPHFSRSMHIPTNATFAQILVAWKKKTITTTYK